MSLTQRVAKKLPTDAGRHGDGRQQSTSRSRPWPPSLERWGRLDGALHSIGFMPQDALGGNFMTTPWESVAIGFQTSAFSLKALGGGPAGADEGGGRRQPSVSLTFDGAVRLADLRLDGRGQGRFGGHHPLPGTRSGEHGIRVNTVSAGPIRTMAGKNIPGFDQIAGSWLKRAPLGWSLTDATPVGQMVLLPVQRLVEDDHRRDDPRRRRLPRHGDRYQLLSQPARGSAGEHLGHPALMVQQPRLAPAAPAIVAELAALAHHPMARDHEGDPVGAIGRARRPLCARAAPPRRPAPRS